MASASWRAVLRTASASAVASAWARVRMSRASWREVSRICCTSTPAAARMVSASSAALVPSAIFSWRAAICAVSGPQASFHSPKATTRKMTIWTMIVELKLRRDVSASIAEPSYWPWIRA